MKKKAIDGLLLYKVVEIELVDGTKIVGWLVPKGNGYLILPIYDIWHTYECKASHIKGGVCHKTNNVKVFDEEGL